MRARDIVGKRVVAVKQGRDRSNADRSYWGIEEIVFDDGSSMTFGTVDRENDGSDVVGTYHPAVKRCSVALCILPWDHLGMCEARSMRPEADAPRR